ncbi:MAG TPA: hypothetical protein VGD08_12795, partial [Stellaceae bacterium]
RTRRRRDVLHDRLNLFAKAWAIDVRIARQPTPSDEERTLGAVRKAAETLLQRLDDRNTELER